MKHFGNQLDEIFKKKRIVQKEFAAQLGVTEVTITKWKSLASIDAAKLETVSKMLNVPITSWFDDIETNVVNKSVAKGNGSAASVYGNATAGVIIDKDKEIEHLKQLLKEKERTIQILMNK